MTKFREKIDDIFEALYGSKISDDTKLLYSMEYEYESENMGKFIYQYLKCMKSIKYIPTINELARITIFAEYITIGNNECYNIHKLEQIMIDIWDDFNFIE